MNRIQKKIATRSFKCKYKIQKQHYKYTYQAPDIVDFGPSEFDQIIFDDHTY